MMMVGVGMDEKNGCMVWDGLGEKGCMVWDRWGEGVYGMGWVGGGGGTETIAKK